jgi:iron complex outermembrane recepter protein
MHQTEKKDVCAECLRIIVVFFPLITLAYACLFIGPEASGAPWEGSQGHVYRPTPPVPYGPAGTFDFRPPEPFRYTPFMTFQPQPVYPASFQEQLIEPILRPLTELQPRTPLPSSLIGKTWLTGTNAAWRPPRDSMSSSSISLISGREAERRVTTDVGDLLGRSPSALGVGVQRRTPTVTEPRVRGSRVGQLAASGSHWVPARLDLDTALSKIDSRIIDDIAVFKGPYSALYGPGLHFMDVQLQHSPRYENGFQAGGATGVTYKMNGEQWRGRQALHGGAENWGFRFNYGHGVGDDYQAGDGSEFPSSYKSREIDLAFGFDLTEGRTIEFNYLRLDQTDIEYPGQAFDMDYLVTDGFELQYMSEEERFCDELLVEGWYNNTRFEGNAQSAGKRQQFPFLNYIRYTGHTDVNSSSSGFRSAATWKSDDEESALTAGVDMRHIGQELNEISSGRIGFNMWIDANSPIPRSEWINPGLFAEYETAVGDRLTMVAGTRVDWTNTGVTDDPAKLQALGLQQPQSSLADILGTSEFDQNFDTWAAFARGRYELDRDWSLLFALGQGQRPPSLTELYAAQPFMFLLQNGLNNVTGDPHLLPERSWQIDLGIACEREQLRFGLNGFHAWVNDYITFENMDVFRAPPFGQIEQIDLKFVNTDLATFVGFEAYVEYDVTPSLTPFATIQYVDGRDRTRNGDFATREAWPGSPSYRDYAQDRGFYSGIAGAAEEPLPGITPLESRAGLRFQQGTEDPSWWFEISARMVADQDQVAASLLEQATPGFVVGDIRSAWNFGDQWSCVAGVENFTNEHYRDPLDLRSATGLSVYQPGVNFYFGTERRY